MSDSPTNDLYEARRKAQLAGALAKCEAEIIISAMDVGDLTDWVAMLRRVAALLEANRES